MATFLVLQAARFGDLVQSKRLIRTLQERGQVHLGVDVGLATLARLLYPGAEVHGLRLHGQPGAAALAENRAVFRQWREMAFQAVYNCNFSPVTAAVCRLFDPEIVMGYRPARTPEGGITRSAWARLAFRLSERRVFSPLNLVDFWGHFTSSPLAAEHINPSARPGGQGLGVVLAGRESRRSLPLPLLASILQTLFGLLDGPKVRLLGSGAEQPVAHKLQRLLPAKVQGKVEDLSGKTDWPGLIHAVEGLDALLTPDTGIMHLAAHLGVPALAFFLSSAWCHETGPYGRGHAVWQSVRSCAPCLESAPCLHRVACLEALQGKELLRSLALAVRPEARIRAELPDGLQFWRSDLDALGGVLRLDDGRDPHAPQRAFTRALLAEFLHLPENGEAVATGRAESPEPADPAEQAALRDWLCHDADWMLPPGRYC
ncbi:glycosyltransferase family 9 protein [uncultured Desulfovibrio sp.]|uniref:glycosyltransferase family 9 protein n=1 Tax=uncultured Desulfovibrio sp. TaxID=167968 RepID=UPI00261E6070|nr:glycosyltransferase family 9 protein [uncultured Desulfovibrio sp.]